MRYERISADCHIDLCQLPPDLFTSNTSAALRDRMPYVTDSPKVLDYDAAVLKINELMADDRKQ